MYSNSVWNLGILFKRTQSIREGGKKAFWSSLSTIQSEYFAKVKHSDGLFSFLLSAFGPNNQSTVDIGWVDQPSTSISTMNKMSMLETAALHWSIVHIISTSPPLYKHGRGVTVSPFVASDLFCTVLSSCVDHMFGTQRQDGASKGRD